MVWVPVPQGQTSHVIRDLEYGREYDVKVRAVNQIGPGDPTAAIRLPVVDRSSPAYAVPPQPEGFQCRAGITKVYLTWHNPFAIYANHGRTVVYRHTEDDYANAELVGHSTGISYVDDGGEDGLGGDDPENPPTWYYWILWESIVSVLGPPSEVCAAEMAINPRTAIPAISQQIIDDPLTKALLSPITDPPVPAGARGLIARARNYEEINQNVAQQLVDMELLRQLELLGMVADEVGEDLRAELRLLTARITKAEGDVTVNAGLIALLQATIPNLATASALQILEAQVNTNTGGLARWLVKVAVNELVGGVGLLNDGQSIKFYVAADRFAIIPPGTTTGGIIPFVVSGGRVYINNAVIRDASITTVKIENAFLERLTAIHGELDFARINKGNIFDLVIDGRIRSDNYNGVLGADGSVVNRGTQGFYIGRGGHADFVSILADVLNVDAFEIREKTTIASTGSNFWKQTLGGLDPRGRALDLRNYDYLLINVGQESRSQGLMIPVVEATSGSGSYGSAYLQSEGNTSRSDPGWMDAQVRSPTELWMRSTPGRNFGSYVLNRVLGVKAPGVADSGGGTGPTDTTSTDTDSVRILASSPPSAPGGGTNIEGHTPAGWTRATLTPTATMAVYQVTRIRTYDSDGDFVSATAWGDVREIAAKTGSDLEDADAPAVTISAVASVPEGGTLNLSASVLGGTYDTLTYAWSVVSGGGSIRGSGRTAVYSAPQVGSDTAASVRCTVTARGTGTAATDGTSDTATDTEAFTITDSAGPPATSAPGVPTNLNHERTTIRQKGSTNYRHRFTWSAPASWGTGTSRRYGRRVNGTQILNDSTATSYTTTRTSSSRPTFEVRAETEDGVSAWVSNWS